jgi:hypothetical protein
LAGYKSNESELLLERSPQFGKIFIERIADRAVDSFGIHVDPGNREKFS